MAKSGPTTDKPVELVAIAAPGQTEFEFPFRTFMDAFVFVTVNGQPAVLTDSPDTRFEYSVIENVPIEEEEGGHLLFGAPMVGGERVVIWRWIPIERVTQFPPSGPIPTRSFNWEYNIEIGIMQQLAAAIARAVLFPIGEEGFTLPPASERANRFFYFDADGRPYMLSLEELIAMIGAGGAGVDYAELLQLLRDYMDRPAWTYRYGSFAVADIEANELLLDYHVSLRHSLAANFHGCRFSVAVPPLASWVATVRRNGSSIGTITVGTDGNVTCVAGAITIQEDDIISVHAPAIADAEIERFRMTFVGTPA
jgi:hypothetical protein